MQASEVSPRRRQMAVAAVAAMFLALGAHLWAQAPIAGRNANIVGGPTDLRLTPAFKVLGDPNRAQQNEGSCARSTTNPLHILCGGNDSRMVDIPGFDTEDGDAITGAWGGNFQSIDGGSTWQSTLHPGFRLDSYDDSPLKAYDRITDVVVRPGAGGVAFYSGIAGGKRTSASVPSFVTSTAVFVSTWIDLNDREGDPFPFTHVRTGIIEASVAGRLLDKPWMATGAPVPGAFCSLDVPLEDGASVRRRIPATPVYVGWTSINSTNIFQIFLSRSLDCGATWSHPTLISESSLKNQGVQIAVSSEPAEAPRVVVAWRRAPTVAGGNVTSAILTAVSNNGGLSFRKATVAIPFFCPFDQYEHTGDVVTFRTFAFPALTVDYTGRWYLAFAGRQMWPYGSCGAGQSRILLASSRDGENWSSPVMVNPRRNELGHQMQPSVSAAGDTVQITWLDFRNDAAIVYLGERFIDEADVLNQPNGPLKRRHTGEIWGAQFRIGDVGADTAFTVHSISQYLTGIPLGGTDPRPLQHDAVNLRLFRNLTAPFFSDYSDIAADALVPSDQVPGTWVPNRGQLGSQSFLATFTSNRDVKLLSAEDYARARLYEPPTIPGITASTGDPSQARPACISDLFAGTKNQNLYASRIMAGGLFAGVPGNSKPGPIQRAFVVFAQNAADTPRSVQFAILNQPSSGRASFRQFDGTPDAGPLTVLGPLTIPPKSMVVRSVFVTGAPADLLKVRVTDAGGTFSSTLFLNQALALGGPLRRPESVPAADPAFDPNNYEVHGLRVGGREIDHKEVLSGEQIMLVTSGNGPGPSRSPKWKTPKWANPEWGNPEWANPEWANPEWANADPSGKDTGQVAWVNPGWENPTITVSTTPPGVRDIRFQLTSIANTASSYRASISVAGAIDPTLTFQLVVYRLFAANSTDGCRAATYVGSTDVILNLTNPADFVNVDPATSPATFYLQPGDDATYVNVRVWDQSGQGVEFDPGRVALHIQPQAVDTASAANGVKTPPTFDSAALYVATSSLPDGERGVPYTTTLLAAAGTAPYAWSIQPGSSLPSGLVLDAVTGVISGTPTGVDGTTAFVIRIADAATPARVSSRELSITIH